MNMAKSTKKKTERRAKHSVFLDDKAFNKYKTLKEAITKVTGRRADNSAVIDALITLVAEKEMFDDLIGVYQKKLAERKNIKEETKVDISKYIELLKS